MAVVHSKPTPKSVSRKDFRTVCRHYIGCEEIMHKGVNSCLMASYNMATRTAKGATQFFVPIYLAQLVLRIRDNGLNQETLKGVAVGFARSIMFGVCMATGFIASSCAFHRLLGGYYFYTCVMAPASVGGLAIFFDDPKRRAIVLYTFYNMALEYLMTTNGLRLPRLQETSLFMLISAVLMYQLRTAANRSAIFWFFMPPRSTSRFLGTACPHPGPCWKDIVQCTLPILMAAASYRYGAKLNRFFDIWSKEDDFLQGGAKFAAIAVILQILKIFLSMGLSIVKKPKKAKQRLFSKSTVKLALSLGGYVFIYKTVSCLLCQRFGADRASFGGIAGLVAGAIYAIEPRKEAMSSAVVTVLTLLVRSCSKESIFRRVPGEILMALCNGILFHARCMDAESCPPFIKSMMDTASNQRSAEIYNTFLDRYHDAVKSGLIKPSNGHTST